MLSGVKFLSPDQVQEEIASSKARNKRSSKKEKHRRESRSSHHDSSSSDEELERINKRSGKKKWYSSGDSSLSYSTESESGSESESKNRKRHKHRKRDRRSRDGRSGSQSVKKSNKRSRAGRKYCSSEDESASTSDYEGDRKVRGRKSRKSAERKGGDRKRETDISEEDALDDVKGTLDNRKEAGLEWMLRPAVQTDRKVEALSEPPQDEHPAEEVRRRNPKELNPYLKNNGSGYPEESDQVKTGASQTGASQLLSSSVVGDGGASWRLKALKRAQEQAAREGRKFEEVVEERWGSLGHLAVSVASRSAAPSRAHLHAIKNRKKTLMGESEPVTESQDKIDVEKNDHGDYLKDISLRHPEMRAPKVHDSLSWGKRKGPKYSNRDSGIISAAAFSLNKFSNDGSFMQEFMHLDNADSCGSSRAKSLEKDEEKSNSLDISKNSDENSVLKQTLSANQLAAKALQLRLKGRHEEAEKLLKGAEAIKVRQGAVDRSIGQNIDESTHRFNRREISIQRKKEENSDARLGEWIMKNRQYNVASQADEEYDFDDAPSRKSRKKGADEHKLMDRSKFEKRILTQQERCHFCFENPNRPRHLVVSIANFTYLMLPPLQPIVPGHCYILPVQHESATRTIDDNVWEEIRNFKKCLIMMFGKEDKDLVFLETVMDLAQQRRHCLVECIPLPRDVAKQAPLYFKKAIDEAEDEWSQHHAKRLIDTSDKGLRSSIPKGFPYFHVEFGLNKGFVHVIDDEKNFKKSLGLDVIRGMLRLPVEDMHRRGRRESVEAQKQAVANFAREWEPFDWTKQLG